MTSQEMPSPATRSPHRNALIQLLRTSENLWNASRVFFARWDLGPSQFNILNLLADQPAGCSQVELSRLLVVHRSNVTGLIDRLESRGLVRRRRAAGDRRSYRVLLTPEGRRLLAEILPEYERAAENIWDGLSAARTRALVRDLAGLDSRLAAFVSSHRPPGKK